MVHTQHLTGSFAAAGPDGFAAAIDDNKRMIDEAAAIGAECIVAIGGGLPGGSRDLPAARKMFSAVRSRSVPPIRSRVSIAMAAAIPGLKMKGCTPFAAR